MTTITTRYSIGDCVWHANTMTDVKQHPCPDCNNTRQWQAVSPAGNEYSFACPRCTARYAGHNQASLKYMAHVPLVQQLTIGSIQYNSAADSWDNRTRYMCRETGVGSGSVYDEARLFATEAEALAAAQLIADEANSTQKHVVEQFNRTLEISDYQLENALLKDAADAKRRAGHLLWNLNDLFDGIKEADDKDAIIELVDDYQTYSWPRDKDAAFEREGAVS